MSFGSRFKERREQMGFTQGELGRRLGVTGSAIGNYENEVSSPKAEILYKVFNTLECDANYLFQDEMQDLQQDIFTPEEISIIKKYRSLPPEGQETVSVLIDNLGKMVLSVSIRQK